ncbi:MAG TPA: hypothetical protein VIV35_10065 [Chitinophagaceae bacterium]
MRKSEKKLNVPVQEKVTAYQIHQKSSYTGKTPKQIMTNHIRDRNDVITEEDFRNLNISIDITDETATRLLELTDNNERPKDEDKDPEVITPWDIINE